WLDLPETAEPAQMPAATPIPVTLHKPEQPKMPELVPLTMPAPVTAAGITGAGRQDRILVALVAIFEELSGTRIGLDAKAATFLELGFDSLFLTQVTRGLQNKIGLKVTFRQLLGQQNSLEALAKYADEVLPKDAFPEPKAEAPAAPAPTLAPAPPV